MKTKAPSSVKRFAVAKPIPVVPPVTTATFPCNLPIIVAFFFAYEACRRNARRLRTKGRCRRSKDYSVQQMSSGYLTVEPTADIRDRILVEAGVEAAGDVADMRRCQQVRQRAERMVERQWLLVKDIDGSTGDLLGFERGNEIRLDHDRAARRVYQARRRFHERQFRGTDKAARPS